MRPVPTPLPATPPSEGPAEQTSASDDPLVGQHSAAALARIGRWRMACAALLLALIVLGVGWELWWAPLPGGSGGLALKVLPLTLGVAGVLKHRLYTFRWLSLLVWLYFTEGIMRAVGDRGWSQWLAMSEILLSVALFVGCARYVRLRLRVLPSRKQHAGAEPNAQGASDVPRAF